MKHFAVSTLLYFIFFLLNSANDLLKSYEFSPTAIVVANLIGVLCLLTSFILAFASAIMWETDRDTKAFSLIFVGLAFGFLLPGFLLPLIENPNPAIPFYVGILKNIALYSSAGCAGSLFAISAERYSINQVITSEVNKCECVSSRKETIKLSGQVSKLTKLIYIAFVLQFILVVALIAI